MQDSIRPSLFVSDLHLTPERPAITEAFFRFLGDEARGANSLYILGDLFDYWIGDDDLDDPFATQITDAIGALAHSGCSVYVMHGNRDFLMGERLCHAASALPLNDPTVVELGGRRTLLLHGDTLCIDDPDYMTFRNQVRDADWQATFLAKSLEERRRIAHGLRADSRSSQRGKTETIMDVAPRAVIEAFRRCECDRMIHGHTHRPARHEHVVDGRTCERWVLGDWYTRGSCLRVDAKGIATAIVLPLA